MHESLCWGRIRVTKKIQSVFKAKETIGDCAGRKYANSKFSNQNRQDAISRVSDV